MLNITNISKRFGDKQILNNISLGVEPGEIAFLLGPSGVGKSTLLRILNNLEEPSKGTLTLDGQPLTSDKVGIVFQQFHLFENLTVEQNILFPLIRGANKSVIEAHKITDSLLARYGLTDKAQKYISKLSGGQKQRLAIARSIAMKPQIMCLDEPTSALDPLLTNHVAQAIQDLAQENYIVLVASHDIALLKQLPCTIYLMNSSGEIAQTASSTAFEKDPDQFPLIKKFVAGTHSS